MNKLSLMIAALALAGVACGDSDSKKDSDAGGGGMDGGNNGVVIPDEDAGGDDDDDKPVMRDYPECDAEAAIAVIGGTGMKWTETKPWNEDDLAACMVKCPMAEFECFETMCPPNGALFVECFSNEVGLCVSGSESSPCRIEFENLACCTDAEGCTASQPDFDACIAPGGKCAEYVTDYQACNMAPKARACQTTAVSACVGPEGGTSADAGAGDAGVDEGDAGADAAVPASNRLTVAQWLNAAAQNLKFARIRK